MSLKEFKRILTEPLVKNSYDCLGDAFDISFCGGEPFLVPYLQDFVDATEKECPGSFKAITTNGLLTGNILAFVRKNQRLNFKINISLDGIGGMHDSIRGIDGAFDKVIKTVLGIKKLNPSQRIELKFTLLPANHGHIKSVYALARKLGCDFSFKPAENIESYTNRYSRIDLDFSSEQLCSIRNQALAISDDLDRAGNIKRSAFMRDIPFYLFKKNRKESCSVLDNDMTILPDGMVYSCIKMEPLGNAGDASLNRLWSNRRKQEAVCPSCMLMCGAYKDYNACVERVKTANIESTLRCNLKCNFCTQKDLRSRVSTDMGMETFIGILKQYPDIRHVSFVGGEPFINASIFDMMRTLDSKSMTYEVTTNGSLLDKKKIDALKQMAGLKKINFSLDGRQRYHDKNRGRGVYKACKQAILTCNGFLNVSVTSVLMGDNLNDILGIFKLLNKEGIKRFKVVNAVSFDRRLLCASLKRDPSLLLQGPSFSGRVPDARNAITAYKKISQGMRSYGVDIIFEPDAETLGHEAEKGAGRIFRCRQLKQYRFDPSGERIVCEFIRNPYRAEIADKLEKEMLPLCIRCCKLEYSNNKDNT